MSWLAAGASVAGNVIGGLFGSSSASKNRKFQREVAQNQIQWRVADAQKAGIHPLYAMGAPVFSPSPVQDDTAQYFAQAGQDISRAIQARQSERERRRDAARQEIQDRVQAERDGVLFAQQVERNNLENQALAQQLARNTMSAQMPPASPDATRTRTVAPGTVDEIPSTVVVGSRDNNALQPGAITDFQFARIPGGGLTPVMSEQMKERTEDDLFAQVPFYLRHVVGRGFRGGGPTHRPDPRQFPLPPGQSWEWDFDRQAYYPFDRAVGWIRDGRTGSRAWGPRETLSDYRRRSRRSRNGGGGF